MKETVVSYDVQRKMERRNAERLQDKVALIQLGVVPVESIEPLLHVLDARDTTPAKKAVNVL
jgi:hypothetical protein